MSQCHNVMNDVTMSQCHSVTMFYYSFPSPPGKDILDGNKTLTLALVWQLMRAYTLSLLSRLNPGGTPIVESEIITWANNRLKEGGRADVEIKSFQDKSLKDAIPILQLVDTITPGSVNWDVVIKGDRLSDEVENILRLHFLPQRKMLKSTEPCKI